MCFSVFACNTMRFTLHNVDCIVFSALSGVAVMVHGDNKGLVLPPRVAPIQAIICPIAMKSVDYSELVRYADDIKHVLKRLGVRVDIDSREVSVLLIISGADVIDVFLRKSGLALFQFREIVVEFMRIVSHVISISINLLHFPQLLT